MGVHSQSGWGKKGRSSFRIWGHTSPSSGKKRNLFDQACPSERKNWQKNCLYQKERTLSECAKTDDLIRGEKGEGKKVLIPSRKATVGGRGKKGKVWPWGKTICTAEGKGKGGSTV